MVCLPFPTGCRLSSCSRLTPRPGTRGPWHQLLPPMSPYSTRRSPLPLLSRGKDIQWIGWTQERKNIVSGIWFQRIAIILPVRIFLGSLTFKNKLSYNPHAKAVAIRCNNIFFGKRNIEFELKSGTLTLYFSLNFFKFSSFVKETTAAFLIP